MICIMMSTHNGKAEMHTEGDEIWVPQYTTDNGPFVMDLSILPDETETIFALPLAKGGVRIMLYGSSSGLLLDEVFKLGKDACESIMKISNKTFHPDGYYGGHE